MRRIFIAAFAAIAAFTMPALAASDIQTEILSHTVQINHSCSGTIIWSNRDKKTGDVGTYVLTAKHCVRGESQNESVVDIPVYQKNRVVKRDSYIAEVYHVSSNRDLALLKLLDTQTFFPVTAAVAGDDIDIEMGDPVIAAGYPASIGLTFTRGDFIAVEYNELPTSSADFYRATVNIAGGSSGGGLFRKSADGGKFELIGVTTAMRTDADFMSLYTTAPDIYAFLGVALPESVGR
ncbi:S1 family peptidase [Pseudohoeflea suaedae]|nr:serine protease [Pseudohoeflea suaedae]